MHKDTDEVDIVWSFRNMHEIAGYWIEEESCVDETYQILICGESWWKIGNWVCKNEHDNYQTTKNEIVHEISEFAWNEGAEIDWIAHVLDGLKHNSVIFLSFKRILDIEDRISSDGLFDEQRGSWFFVRPIFIFLFLLIVLNIVVKIFL